MTVAVTLPDHLDTRPVKRNDSVLVRTAGDSTKHAPLPSLHGAFPWRNATLEFGSALDPSHNRCTRPLRRLFINRPQLDFLLSSSAWFLGFWTSAGMDDRTPPPGSCEVGGSIPGRILSFIQLLAAFSGGLISGPRRPMPLSASHFPSCRRH